MQNNPRGLKRIPREGNDSFPVSTMQERMINLEKSDNGYLRFNYSFFYHISGLLNEKKLIQSIKKLILDQESLRTYFPIINGKNVQKIVENPKFKNIHILNLENPIECWDINAFNKTKNKKFNIEESPPIDIYFLKFNNNNYGLVFFLHHLIFDGYSINLIESGITDYYHDKKGPKQQQLQYKDFALWQRKKSNQLYKGQMQYWEDKLKGGIGKIQLPKTKNYINQDSLEADYVSLEIRDIVFKGVKNYCELNNSTVFLLLLSLTMYTLRPYFNEKVSVGIPVTNRNSIPSEDIIGYFANKLIIQVENEKNSSFSEFFNRVKKTFIEAINNQNLPFELLQEMFSKVYNQTLDFEVAIMHEMQSSNIKLQNALMKPIKLESGISKFDLAILFLESSNGVEVLVQYKKNLYEKNQIMDFINNLKNNLRDLG